MNVWKEDEDFAVYVSPGGEFWHTKEECKKGLRQATSVKKYERQCLWCKSVEDDEGLGRLRMRNPHTPVG